MGGYSYQDIESRLRSVEDMLEFVMTTMRMKAAITTGVLDAQGKPQAKLFDGNMVEMYRLSKQLPVIEQSSEALPPVDEAVG